MAYPETNLALRLSTVRPIPSDRFARDHALACIATLAHNVTRYATQARRLREAGCNAELTSRKQKTLDRADAGADDLLRPYGYRMGNPWGLCHYAIPLECNDDYLSEGECVFLA